MNPPSIPQEQNQSNLIPKPEPKQTIDNSLTYHRWFVGMVFLSLNQCRTVAKISSYKTNLLTRSKLRK